MKITLKNLIKLIVLSAWIFLSVSFPSAAQGQTVYKRGATQLENLLPPAPEAASAVRFVDVPFSHSQGLACLDIPVYTVKGRELSIPVSLSYASGGVKLDEVAGVAGLGWRLEAGGCVTRTVVDMPDEFLSAELSHGMPSQAMLAKLDDPDDRSSEKAAFLRDIVWHRTDVSLDRYSYNVCGLSGSFVILDDGSVFHLSGDGVVLAATDFGAYGKPSSVAGAPSGSAQLPQGITIRDGFTGQEDQSPDFGTLYTDFGARQYTPDLGRWLAPDPLSEKYYGISPYAYCAGNPISVIDDGGRDLVLVGKGNSSVTFRTDLIDMSVNISRLGVDWKGNYSFEGNRLLGVALDVAGIFDPTPTSDLANASLQWSEGRHMDAVVSALGTIPYAGDLAKLTRVGKDIRIISDAVEGVRFTKNLRKSLTRTTGHAPKGMQAHHIFPRKFEKYFSRHGIDINDPKYGVWMDEHRHLSGAWEYNKEWEDFFLKNDDLTKEKIMEHAEELMNKIYKNQ